MNLEKACKNGSMSVAEFVELLKAQRPVRMDQININLRKGDYVVLRHAIYEDIIELEQIIGVDSPENGDFDFATVRGTTGPIRGNIFVVGLQKGRCPNYLLIEGDRVGKDCRVYEAVKKYLGGIEAGISTLRHQYGWGTQSEGDRTAY